jgi:hypothetical protein
MLDLESIMHLSQCDELLARLLQLSDGRYEFDLGGLQGRLELSDVPIQSRLGLLEGRIQQLLRLTQLRVCDLEHLLRRDTLLEHRLEPVEAGIVGLKRLYRTLSTETFASNTVSKLKRLGRFGSLCCGCKMCLRLLFLSFGVRPRGFGSDSRW